LNTEDEWLECGAWCIKFYDSGQEDIIIIDDFMPKINGNWPFTSGGEETEMWP